VNSITTIEGFKTLLGNPIFLFLCMGVGQLGSILRQWWVARQAGATMGFGELLTYWPQILSGIGGSVVAFVGLIETNTLNFVSAMAIGALSNTLTDIIASRRSKAVVDSIPADTDHDARK
jgi:hypothetical protein